MIKTNSTWIYGRHAVVNALGNKERHPKKIFLSESFKDKQAFQLQYSHIPMEVIDNQTFSKKFGENTVHQGIALQTFALKEKRLEDVLEESKDQPSSLVVVLDQITDPHNVGAISRSAAAFGTKALIIPKHQSVPLESPVLAKISCGGIEHVPFVTVTNLARTLDLLKDNGYWCIGLDEQGSQPLRQAPLEGKIALVLGAEGEGLRRLTKGKCDLLVYLETNPKFPTLNVSNAAAIAFYEYRRQNSLQPSQLYKGNL